MTTDMQQHLVDKLVDKAKTAQQHFANGCQQDYDHAALAAAWAILQPERNHELATMAVETTGLGNISDKITKNHRKTLGLLRDIQHVKTTGIIENDRQTGITTIARAVGVVGAVTPSTNPVATPINNIVNSLKCGNAIIFSPSPKGTSVAEKVLGYVHAEFDRLGINHDLVQMIPAPSTKVKTQRLMEKVDLLIVTGSQDNVRRAYASGTPAIGVGAGNATVIVDETADLQAAAEKITASKCFDNATSCSSENALVVVDEVFQDFLAAITPCGGRLLDHSNARKLMQALFQDGHLNRNITAKDVDAVLAEAQIQLDDGHHTKFLLIEGRGIGQDYPESGEKLSLVTTLYKADNFQHAKEITKRILQHQGAGHSVGLHSADDTRALELAQNLPTCRVIVNQAHCFATGGSFTNGMPFSLSMGCGSWGGNSIDDNLHYKHFMNKTKIVRPIPAREPTLDELFKDYWKASQQ